MTITVNLIPSQGDTDLKVHLETSQSAFGPESGPIWGGSTFWVSAYVEDLRDVPLGVVGGAIDVAFDAAHVTPTGNVVYGTQFTAFRQGAADAAAGMIDEAGALTTEAGVGANGLAPFVAWEFRRNGSGTADDANSVVSFAAEPGEGTTTILPANFALVGQGTAVDWSNVEFDTASLNLYLGDFNHDGSVNHVDLALWIPQASSIAGNGVFNSEFDLSCDARVDSTDLSLLMSRLYQPVLGDSQLPVGGSPNSVDAHPSGNAVQSRAVLNRPAANASRGAVFAQLATSGWNATADLSWTDAILSHHPHKSSARHDLAAVDKLMTNGFASLCVM